MIDLKTRDFWALNDAILLMHNDHLKATFPARLEAALLSLVQADITAVECFNEKGVWTERMLSDASPLLEKHFPAFLQEHASHPLVTLFEAGKLWQPIRISDVVNQRSLHDLPIYTEFLKPIGVDKQMAVALRQSESSRHAVLVFSRKGKDFTMTDQLRISTFIPHVISARRIAGIFSDANKLLPVSPTTVLPLETRFGVTAREAHILHWLAHGKTDQEIADICEISKRTVHKHCQNIYQKLGVECRTSAVMTMLDCLT